MAVTQFHYKKELKQNPFTGFVSFNHFNGDELYSDLIIRPENNFTETEYVECYPIPTYVEEKGRAQGYYPDCSVVYIRSLWKEFEPQKGAYNYEFLEGVLQKAKENGQTVMFRLMPHSTRESDDVPDWLKNEIECPKRPKGQRVKASPSDPKFLELFGKAIEKIGERFDKNPTLAFMDISLPGAWGEGESVSLFTQEQIKALVDVYTDNFKETLLISQASPWIVQYLNENANVGWRADCIGRPDLTFERVPFKAQQIPEIWRKGHISFESYWWLGEWQRQGWDINKIFDLLLSLHVSTFNAKSLPIPYEWQEQIDNFIAKMGYHFVIDCCKTEVAENKLKATLTIENVGVAPIYKKLPLHFALLSGKETFDYISDIDITKWQPGKNEVKIEIPLCTRSKNIQLGVGIFDEYTYVYFATDAEFNGKYYKIAEVSDSRLG